MTVLFDTNVVLDVLMEREPYAGDAARLFALVDNGRITGLIGATTVTTIFYIASRGLGPAQARQAVRALLRIFGVAAVDREVLSSALELGFDDYEDAVLHEAARAAGAVAIATRDRRGFRAGSIPALAPRELMAAVAAAG